MIISEEQVRLAVAYLQDTESGGRAATGHEASGLTPEFIERVRSIMDAMPDTRADRCEHARAIVDGQGPSSVEVAEKMIGRIISDSLR